MKFYFCETCGKRITEEDVEAGQARNKKLKGVYCAHCAVGVMTLEMLPVSEGQARTILGKASATQSDTPLPSAGASGKPKRESAAVHLAAVRKPGESLAPARSKQSPASSNHTKTNSLFIGVCTGLAIALVLGARLLLWTGENPKPEAGGKVPLAKGSTKPNLPYTLPAEVRKTIALPAEAGKSIPASGEIGPGSATRKDETAVAKTAEVPQRPTEPTPAPVAGDEALGPPKEISLNLGGGVKMELVLIPAGEFEMGSNAAANEKPVHKVKISRSFYMGIYVVTQAQFERVMGHNPSQFRGENLPVEQVGHDDAEEFCKKVSSRTGKSTRLPTEAEWEYACRAGTKTMFNTGDKEAALEQAGWYKNNSEGRTHPVGQKKPNAWGLYDMHGNVQQWCQDWYGEDYYAKAPAEDPQGPAQGAIRVFRGGSWSRLSYFCRSAFRHWRITDTRNDTAIGFRVVAMPASRTP